MPQTPLEVLCRDRIGYILGKNDTLAGTMIALTKQILRVSSDLGWLPHSIPFATPHLDGLGKFTFRFDRGRRGYCRYRSAYSETEFHYFRAAIVEAQAEFVARNRTWRKAIDEVYAKSERFAREGEQEFGRLVFGTAKLRPQDGRAWFTAFRSSEQETAASLRGE